jgi:hypothetical protein
MTTRARTATLEAEITRIKFQLRTLTYPDFDKLPKMNSKERRKSKRALHREWQRRKRALELRWEYLEGVLGERARRKFERGMMPGHYGANQ